MPEPKWTKGPWLIGSFDDADDIIEISTEERAAHNIVPIVEIEIGYDDEQVEAEQQANTRLIAAAPNLYRACEGLKEALDRAMDYIGNGYQPQDIVAEAREARDQADLFMAQARGDTDA